MSIQKLPEKIAVEIKKLSKGKYFVNLPDYDVFTEAENESEIDLMINDLIYTLFDVPKNLQKQFHYHQNEQSDYKNVKPFIIFSTPGFYRKYIQ